LLRRPDVIEAEYLLRAADADLGVARAELFPRVTLSALLGLVSGGLGFSLGGDASQRLFDGGARRAGVAVSAAQRRAAVASYERAIQTAFREVADALAVQGTVSDRLRAASANTAAAADAARLSEARYRGGIESFLSSLDAQRSLYAAQRAEAAVRLALVRNRIALFAALGGTA
ncbi:MAG: TolC family protein, partial [Novosphingobium sp.]